MPELRDDPDTEWEDLFAMLDDVHAHVRATGREVEVHDDPFRLRLGYRDPVTDKTWRIRLTRTKEAFGPSDDPRANRSGLYCELIKTAEGRRRLANLPLASAPVA